MIPVILGITFIIFMVLSLSPGDPASLVLGQDASAEALAAKHAEMGIDKPVIIQYVDYMANVVKGDFGTSWIQGYKVLPEFLLRIPNTLLLGTLGMLISIVLGIPFGIIAAIRQYHITDYFSLAIAVILFSLPSFWLGMMCQVLFCLDLGWLPAAGVGSLKNFVLPALTLGANLVAVQLRMTRTSMLDVVKQDYVRTARAKGASEKRVIMKHVLRNGMLPVVTQIGISFAAVMGGSILTETVFSIPGIGTLIVNAVKSKDIPVVMGTMIFIAIFVGVINLIVDIIYAFIDPRVRLER